MLVEEEEIQMLKLYRSTTPQEMLSIPKISFARGENIEPWFVR